MAGEWLKFECATPDKPEVFAITTRLGWDDPDLTVGKLFRIWRWFDQQTIDGNAAGVTAALLDRISGVSGFAAAMAEVGWLVIDAKGVTLPNFEKHNGATAKSRAQTAKRVANLRSNAPTVTGNGTGALAREEKRREDKEHPPTPKGELPGFAAFWQAWPSGDRKQAKGKCLDAWKKAGAEPHAALVLAHVDRMKSSSLWTKQGGEFIPAPLVYLGQRRWEGASDESASTQGAFV